MWNFTDKILVKKKKKWQLLNRAFDKRSFHQTSFPTCSVVLGPTTYILREFLGRVSQARLFLILWKKTDHCLMTGLIHGMRYKQKLTADNPKIRKDITILNAKHYRHTLSNITQKKKLTDYLWLSSPSGLVSLTKALVKTAIKKKVKLEMILTIKTAATDNFFKEWETFCFLETSWSIC